MKVRNETVDGTEIQISIENDEFVTRLGDGPGAEEITAPTVKGLLEKARVTLRKRRIQPLEATRLTTFDGHIEDVTVVGIHQGNHNVLYRVDQDPRRRVQQNYNSGFYVRFTDEDKMEYTRLRKAELDATNNLRAWLHARRLNVASELEKLANPRPE